MLEAVSSGRDVRKIFRAYRDLTYPDSKTASLVAQISTANVLRAFNGILSKKIILSAIGDAKTPNAVSLAVRTSLPKF